MKRHLIILLTAPGVILHELGHLIFCIFSGVRIYKVKLFGFGHTAGFVQHAEPESFFQSLSISFGPLLFNSLVSLIFFSQFGSPYFSIKNFLIGWIGMVSGLHAMPSSGDANTLFAITSHKIKRNPLAVVGFPFVGLIHFLNFLKRFHLQLIYVALLFWLGNIYLK